MIKVKLDSETFPPSNNIAWKRESQNLSQECPNGCIYLAVVWKLFCSRTKQYI